MSRTQANLAIVIILALSIFVFIVTVLLPAYERSRPTSDFFEIRIPVIVDDVPYRAGECLIIFPVIYSADDYSITVSSEISKEDGTGEQYTLPVQNVVFEKTESFERRVIKESYCLPVNIEAGDYIVRFTMKTSINGIERKQTTYTEPFTVVE